MTPSPVSSSGPLKIPIISKRSAFWQVVSLAVSLTLTGCVLLFLLWSPFGARSGEENKAESTGDAVQITGPRELTIKADSVLNKKLNVAEAQQKEITEPVLTVTGSVVARLASGNGPAETRWDFHSSELATAYADWIKARADAVTAKGQLDKIKSLTDARVAAATEVAERLRKLVDLGSDSLKDLRAAENDLRQAVLQGQKDVYDSEMNLASINRTRASLERQMHQQGMDPALLSRSADGTTIVVADVPETRIGLVQPEQACVATFFAFKNQTFQGKVASLSPNVSREKRTLRVFFELHDLGSVLKPGLFAEIGLGVDPRNVTLIPADAVLHVGQSDYVLAGGDSGRWRIQPVTVGEVRGKEIEVSSGLKPGERVLGSGAILLKPLVVRALQS